MTSGPSGASWSKRPPPKTRPATSTASQAPATAQRRRYIMVPSFANTPPSRLADGERTRNLAGGHPVSPCRHDTHPTPGGGAWQASTGSTRYLVQETYARAWQRWRRLAGYDDQEAWLRLVVTRLATDRWRRLGVRRAAAASRPPAAC